MHEMMYALGIVYEQSRPDRDEFLQVKYENIKLGNFFTLSKELICFCGYKRGYELNYFWNHHYIGKNCHHLMGCVGCFMKSIFFANN